MQEGGGGGGGGGVQVRMEQCVVCERKVRWTWSWVEAEQTVILFSNLSPIILLVKVDHVIERTWNMFFCGSHFLQRYI